MSPKLPVVSGKEVIKVFQKIGYIVVRQRSSHIRLRDKLNPLHKPLTVPDHKEIKLVERSSNNVVMVCHCERQRSNLISLSTKGLRSLFRVKRGISEFASASPRNRFHSSQ